MEMPVRAPVRKHKRATQDRCLFRAGGGGGDIASLFCTASKRLASSTMVRAPLCVCGEFFTIRNASSNRGLSGFFKWMICFLVPRNM